MHCLRVCVLLLSVVSMGVQASARNPHPSLPYISGDAFRALADYRYDELGRCTGFELASPSIIFVKTDFLDDFFREVHPRINTRYTLITHNSDAGAPGVYEHYLSDDKLIHWFGQNPTSTGNPKFSPIPIGIPNREWQNPDIYTARFKGAASNDRPTVAYLNISPQTHSERKTVYDLLRKQPFVNFRTRISNAEYCEDLTHSQFVISPRGNGLDTHRTWESLMADAIPIVRTSPLDSIYEGLPVIIVNDWSEVTESFLQKQRAAIRSQDHTLEKIYFAWWEDTIKQTLRDAI